MTRPRRLLLSFLAVLLAATPACPPRDGETPPTSDVVAPSAHLAVEGVVTAARLEPVEGERATAQQATLSLRVVAAPDAPGVPHDTRLSVHPMRDGAAAERPLRVAKPDDRLSLPSGAYEIRVTHSRGPAARGEGVVRGLVLESGTARRLVLDVSLPTATLVVVLTNGDAAVGPVARHRVAHIEADGTEQPVAEGGAEGRHVLPLGRYRVCAEASWSDAARAEAQADVALDEVDGEVSVPLDLGRSLGWLRPTARSDGRAVDDDTEFRVYRAGVDPESPGAPLLSGWGGDALALPPGRYAVVALRDAGPLLHAARWYEDIVVKPGATTPFVADLTLVSGRLRFRVLRDGRSVEAGVTVRVSPAGAPADAEPLGTVDGPGPIALPPGRYDVEVRHAPSPGADGESVEERVHRERGVLVEAGEETVREVRF